MAFDQHSLYTETFAKYALRSLNEKQLRGPSAKPTPLSLYLRLKLVLHKFVQLALQSKAARRFYCKLHKLKISLPPLPYPSTFTHWHISHPIWNALIRCFLWQFLLKAYFFSLWSTRSGFGTNAGLSNYSFSSLSLHSSVLPNFVWSDNHRFLFFHFSLQLFLRLPELSACKFYTHFQFYTPGPDTFHFLSTGKLLSDSVQPAKLFSTAALCYTSSVILSAQFDPLS